MNKYINQAKAALITAAVVLVVIGVARRAPVVGPYADKAVKLALG